MRFPSVPVTVLLLFFIPAVACGQDTATAASAGDDATHAAIRQLRDDLIATVNGKDADALIGLLHEDVVLTTQDGEQLATIRGRAAVRDYIDRMLIGPAAGVSQMAVNPVVDELTILHGDDAGIAYGSSTDDYTLRDGSQFTMKTRWSATLVKDDGDWRLAGLHVSSSLFDNPVLDAVKKWTLIAVSVAALVGLLIGYAAARLLGRSPGASRVAET